MKRNYTRKIVVTGLLAALSSVLMYLNFALPFAPSYLKIDFSDFPALLASFSVGPLSGLAVCLIKNLVSLPASSTGFVGELSNFILSSLFVLFAGLYYKKHRTKKGALTASLIGMFVMAFSAIFTNYFLVYPAYSRIMPIEVIIGMSSKIIPWIDSTLKVVLIFNFPFTLLKGALNALVTFLLYKRISPIIQGKR
ncbi:MAG: ECF transporter S component [Ruminococcaceae bacterium]|nr:ECF transporter S component [Oscillospiraceae bacterium]